MFYIENSIKQSDVQNIINLVSSEEEYFKEKIHSIFQKSVSDVSQVTNEFVNNWVFVIKKQLCPEDIKTFRVICHELAIAFNLSEKYKKEELSATFYDEEILRAEVAKIGAIESSSEFSCHIRTYLITDQTELVQIAKIAAAKDGEAVSLYIQNYRIRDPAALIEIAKIAARQNGWGVSTYIQKYKITDQTALLEIAKIAAGQNGWGVSTYIQRYKITDQTALFEIAKIAAAKDGEAVSLYIQNYRIRDRAALIEIAKIAAGQNGYVLSFYIQNYQIRDQIELLHIFFIGAGNQQLISCRNFLIKKPETEALYPSLLLFQDRELNDYEIEVFIRSTESSLFKEVGEELAREKNILVRDETLRCLALVCLGFQLKEVPLSNQREGEKLIEGLLSLRNPVIRRALIGHLVETLKEETALQNWKDLSKKSTANPRHALPLMLLASLVESEHYQKIAAAFKHKDFKEIRRINVLLECLVMLTKNNILSLEEKGFVVTRLLFRGENPSPKMVYQRALMVFECLSFGKDQEIKELEDPSQLVGILEREFMERFGLADTDDFFPIFLKFQESFRSKDAIFTYAATIERLPPYEKELCKPILQSYVQGIFDGSFKERRYEKKNNPHLQEVFKDPTLEELWKKGAEYSLESFLSEDKGSFKEDKSIDFLAFFIEKIMRDRHFSKDSIPYVADVLENAISLEESLKKVKEAIKSSENGAKVVNLGIQEKMLQLMEPDISSEDTIRILKNLICRLSRINPEVELINDLEGKLATLKEVATNRPQQLYDDWKVVDTDDPALLLVLGSEVSGSCQRVDRDPHISKCLLGYLMDGKNRVVAVVNDKGEIQARCILRLLWDKKSSCPILLQDRIYSQAQCPTQIVDVLNQACLKRARELNLTLLSEKPGNKVYPNPVHSLGSMAPFEYVDADELGVTEGQWFLESVFIQYESLVY